MILQALVGIVFLVSWLNVVRSFPLSAPPAELEGEWVHDYKDAAHELTKAFQQLSVQPREVIQPHHQVVELAPLPESLPWPVHIQGSFPNQWTQSPDEWSNLPSMPSMSHLHHTHSADTDSLMRDYYASQIHPSANSAVYPLPLSAYETHAQGAPTPAESSSLSSASNFNPMDTEHPSWSANSASLWHPAMLHQAQNLQGGMHFDPQGRALNEMMYVIARQKSAAYPAKHRKEDLMAPLTIDTDRSETPTIEALPPHRLPRRVKNSGEGLPEVILLPTIFEVWPSEQLQKEFSWYLKLQFNQNFDTFQDLTLQAQSRSNSFSSDLSKTFRKGSQVYAARLPSASILVTFRTSTLIDKGNRQGRALALWTIDRWDNTPALTLRGLFLVPPILYHRMRNGYGKAVYVVTVSAHPEAAPHDLILQLAPSQ
ncbi:uncharacterized protein UTRI_01126 [Ustilago trichophora]|uniref:Effector family protein Eff1 n=1 Tax=Ustilago trichophora TaxID=86804 RepID=A0A5C3DW57_9BASI|nr:uncharacterized protein UTRI_01126 [Ustilago trichophora]